MIKVLLRHIPKREKKLMIRSAPIINKEKEEQMNAKSYSQVESIPFIATTGRKN